MHDLLEERLGMCKLAMKMESNHEFRLWASSQLNWARMSFSIFSFVVSKETTSKAIFDDAHFEEAASKTIIWIYSQIL